MEIDEQQLPEMLKQALAAARKRGGLDDDPEEDASDADDPMAGV